MPVLDQTTSNSYTGNGVTTVFAYTFKLLDSADVLVTVDGVTKTLTTHYTVSGVGASGGGNITFLAAPANAAEVVIQRDMDYLRETDYQDNGDLLAATLDEDIDRVVMQVQQVRDVGVRSIKIPAGETTDQLITAAAADRANKAVIFDASGNVTVSTDDFNDQLANVTAQAAAAAVSAASASTSASTATTQASNASTSASTASTQASTATTQAGIATTKAGEAATSAAAALVSENNAETAEANAAASAAAAATSETNAETAETNAAASAATASTAVTGGTLLGSFTGVKSSGDVIVGATKKIYLDGVGGVGGDTYLVESGANTVDLYIGGNKVATFNSTGLSGVNTIGVGNAAPSSSGAGITFPATVSASTNANTLDDYEEGTFTPAIFGSSTSGSATYSQQVGNYTKIGNTVFARIYIAWSGHTGTGDVGGISGLPFTAGETVLADVWPGDIALTAGYYLTAYLSSGAAQVNLRQAPVGGGTQVAVAMDAAGTLLCNVIYKV